MSKPIVSVIIASHDGETFIRRCLESIFTEKSLKFEVVVIEDRPTGATQTILRKYFSKEPRLKYIRISERVGAAGARNIAVQKTEGRFIFFLDNDTVILPEWLDKIEPFFKRHPKTGAVQVKIITLNTRKYDSAGELISPLGTLVERARDAQDTGQFEQTDLIFSGKTAGVIMRRKVFEKIGGFDENFRIYWEDTDLCWRTWLSGWEIRFFPSIEVQHSYGTVEKDYSFYVNRQVAYYGSRNMVSSFYKNLEFSSLLFKLPLLIGIWTTLAIGFVIRGKSHESYAIARGLLWNFTHITQLHKNRREVQRTRKITDKQLFIYVGVQKSLSYYIGKACAYVMKKPF